MRRIILLFAMAGVLFYTCTGKPTEVAETPSSREASFYAYTDNVTKTHAGDNYSVLWNADDRISILAQGASNTEYRFTGEDGANAGSFDPVNSSLTAAGPYYAVYPYRSTTSLTSGKLRIGIQAKQAYAAGSFGPGAAVMVVKSEDRNLHFKNLCGLLIISAYGSGSVSSITVSGNSGEYLAGTAVVSFADGEPSVSIQQGGASTSIQMTFNQPVALGNTAETATEFWFAVPPVSMASGFTVSFTDNNGRSTSESTGKTVQIERTRVRRMAPLHVDFAAPTEAAVGEPLPLWRSGYLDIHSVNGGRGEAFYYVMPDGTTMLVDAAGAPPAELYSYGDGNSQGVPSKPSVNVNSGAVIVDYIKHFAPAVAGGRLDYFMTSHYHGDHIGAWRDEYKSFGWQPYDKNGNTVALVNLNAGGFVRNGVAEVGMGVPINKVFDRGDWASRPSEDYYTSGGKKRYAAYVNFLDYSARTYGTVRETLQVGHTDQIVLTHQPSDYNFSIRTIASGGDIWTGSGTGVNTSYVPSAEECDANHEEWAINENIFSNVIHLKYGNFDWFSGGDIQFTGKTYYSWKDIELPISKVMKKVEVMKASHHSTKNTNSTELLGVLKPDVYIAGVWRDVQPNAATLKRVYNANSSVKVFTTNLAESNVTTLKDAGVNPANFCSTGGHVVVRVLPGGGSYYVYVLDDTDQEYKVKAIFGPYTAK